MNVKATLVTFITELGLGLSLLGCNPVQVQEKSPISNTVSPSSTSAMSSASNTAPANSVDTQSAASNSLSAPSPKPSALTKPPLTVEKLKNAEYYFLTKGPIKLVNGKYEDPQTKRTFTMSDVVTYGDLNQDGIKDAATTLTVTVPNSGNFAYLVALINDAGTAKNISAEFLGSGAKVKTLAIKPDRMIEVVMDQYQPGDPDCCPSLKITRSYKLKDTDSTSAAQGSPKK